jgi:pyridoxine 4-dehydrogenase
MLNIRLPTTFALGERIVNRLGYGAMQLTGPGVFGPPKDRANAVAVLREAVERGVNHIDTSDFYGPHITNQIIREALRPYPEHLVIVTKVGAKRGSLGSVHPAMSREDITQAVHDNLRNLGVEVLDVVNMRSMLRNDGPAEGSLEAPLTVLGRSSAPGPRPIYRA